MVPNRRCFCVENSFKGCECEYIRLTTSALCTLHTLQLSRQWALYYYKVLCVQQKDLVSGYLLVAKWEREGLPRTDPSHPGRFSNVRRWLFDHFLALQKLQMIPPGALWQYLLLLQLPWPVDTFIICKIRIQFWWTVNASIIRTM